MKDGFLPHKALPPLLDFMKRNFYWVFLVLTIISPSCNDIDFNPEQWKDWEENESNMHMRWDMVDDLMANYLHKGMELGEVENFMGNVAYDTIQNELVARYLLGPCRSGISYGTLELTFRQGKLSSFEKRCN